MTRWTRVWYALVVALHCAAPPPPLARAAIRVLAFPKWPPLTRHLLQGAPSAAAAPEELAPPEAPDMLACLMAASYTCVQRKTAVYLDALNRLDRVRLLGDFVTAVRTRPVDAGTPAISEPLLEARGFDDVLSLSFLVDSVVRDMFRSHALRVSFPRVAGLAAPSSTGDAAAQHDEARA